MASAAVMAAVRARIEALWSRTPVRFPNELDAVAGAQAPADGSAFLIVQYPVAVEDQITLGAPGSNVFREEGAIRFVMQVPYGAGLDTYAEWLDELRALFRGKQFDGVTTYAASPAISDDGNDDGNFWALSCAIPYQYDVFA